MGEDNKVLDAYEQEIQKAQISANQAQLGQQQQQMDMAMQDENKSMISEQLDVGDVLDKIHNLLRGYVLKRDEKGNMRWTEPEDNDLVILSDYGITTIMRTIQMYLNKNTLLSNYDDKQIMYKMEDFSTVLADNIFMKYDKIFLYPTLEECKDELKKRIHTKVQTRKFALELLDENVDEEREAEIENKIILEMEDRIERELTVIRAQKIKDKLKDFEILIRMIQDTVHSTYQRAWKGQERSTLRTHMHISETKGGMIQQPPQSGGFNPLGILRRR